MTSAVQATTFDELEGVDLEPCALFVAVPSDHADRARLIEAVSAACSRVARRLGLLLEILTGEDFNTTDLVLVPDRQRQVLTNDVDGVIVIHGPSWGCSREYSLAGELLIPRYLCVPEGADRSAASGPEGVGLEAQGGFKSIEELCVAVEAWLEAYASDIRSRRRRRVSPRTLTESLRQPALRAWKVAPQYEQERIARNLGQTLRQIERLLMSEVRYAEAHIGSMLVLANDLGTWASATDRSSPGEGLSGQEFRGFEEARELLELSDDDAAKMLEAGLVEKRAILCLESAGRPPRRSLQSRTAWLALWRRL